MSESFDFEAPDHFTVGAIGRPGQRVFYLQARQARQLVTLKCEKEHVGALEEYLASLLAQLPGRAKSTPEDVTLLEPVDAAWSVAVLRVGHDQGADRIVLEATEAVDEDSGEKPATARFRITRGQAAAFVERAWALMKAGRPICPLCAQAKDPGGHVCPRSNGHAPGRPV
ncbi:MAG: DUF3090 family protein [Candidatus Methylomirabilia bacterium]